MTEPTRPPSSMTLMNRAELRRMGLTTAGVMRLFEEAQTEARRRGCTCGLLHITPARSKADPRCYDVAMYHDATCPEHPLEARRLAEVERKRLVNRVRRLLKR